MTGEDKMPWGKYGPKNENGAQKLKDIPREYFDWLVAQEGFQMKNPQLFKWIKEGDEATSTSVERVTIDESKQILSNAPSEFKTWWETSYGDRLRKQGEHNYIGYMRVALTAWNFAMAIKAKVEEPAPEF